MGEEKFSPMVAGQPRRDSGVTPAAFAAGAATAVPAGEVTVGTGAAAGSRKPGLRRRRPQ